MGTVIKDHEELERLIRQFQAEGKAVVLTNGCFDLIHVGHVRCLRAAKAEGDVLVVALNDDASVRRFKRTSGPLAPEDERAEIITAFECVDYVTFFSEPSADAILDRLRPDVHAKGTDYSVENLPERGRIAIVGDPKEHSSSAMLVRAAEKVKQES